jgi:hypothetical protein
MKIYICKIKILGMPFATVSKERAQTWEQEDESHYFEEMELEDI